MDKKNDLDNISEILFYFAKCYRNNNIINVRNQLQGFEQKIRFNRKRKYQNGRSIIENKLMIRCAGCGNNG